MEAASNEIVENIKVITRGGTEDQIKLAEDRLMSFQTSHDWRQFLLTYLALCQSSDPEVAMVSLIQLRYIIKSRDDEISSEEKSTLLLKLVSLKEQLPKPLVGVYCQLVSLILLQELSRGQVGFVGKILINILETVEPHLQAILHSGFKDHELSIQLTIIQSFIESVGSEKRLWPEAMREVTEKFFTQLLPCFAKSSQDFSHFIVMVLQKVDQIGEGNMLVILEISEVWFSSLKCLVREAQDLSLLYSSFTSFIEGIPSSLEAALQSKQSFDAVIGILNKYMIFLSSSMDFLKNSFDFLSRNLTFLLILLGTPQVVSHISQVEDC